MADRWWCQTLDHVWTSGDDIQGGATALGTTLQPRQDIAFQEIYHVLDTSRVELEWATVHTLNGNQAQAQAQAQAQYQVLQQFCGSPGMAVCTFKATKEVHVDGDPHMLVSDSNNSPNIATLNAGKTDTVGYSDSLQVDTTLGANIAGLVDAQVHIGYGHIWSVGHTYNVSVSHPVSAWCYGEIWGVAPMLRDEGDFTITMGNTAWHLNNTYFDTPNPDQGEHYAYDEKPLTPAHPGAVCNASPVPLA